MDLRNQLIAEHSKENRNQIIAWVGNNEERMRELMSCFFDKDIKLAQRAAWPLGYISEKSPWLVKPYLSEMFDNLENPVHDAVIRNTLRTFMKVDIPEDLEGPLYELCFNYLNDRKQAIAIRVFSMYVLGKIAHRFPELHEELISLIKMHYDDSSAGYKSSSRKVLKQLKSSSTKL